MATRRRLFCEGCSDEDKLGKPLLRVLQDIARGVASSCPACKKPRDLEMTFDFALGGGKKPYKVVSAFFPADPPKWKDGQEAVEFWPALVVLYSKPENKYFHWLPYWHVVTSVKSKTRIKYGQWAPFLGLDLHMELVEQARATGIREPTAA